MVSLGQVAVLASAAGSRRGPALCDRAPFPVVVITAGLITMVIGTLVGLPALRMSGLYLALVTLMLAGAIRSSSSATTSPTGARASLGYNEISVHAPAIRRPLDRDLRSGVLPLLGGRRDPDVPARLVHIRGKPGRAWAAIRQSEPPRSRPASTSRSTSCGRFALASFITGVAGAWSARQLRAYSTRTTSRRGLDHALRRRADGRGLQPLGRGHRAASC